MEDSQLIAFMNESNKIEGEEMGKYDLAAAKFSTSFDFVPENIRKLHGIVASGRNCKPGKWRTCQVYVGSYIPPKPQLITKQMETFCRQWPIMDSWQAHNLFERIHPFQDLNGRVGRLLWLNKAIKEGYSGRLSFLHKYYYQTLQHDQH